MFEPLNRYIQIEVEQSKHETDTGILLPADFSMAEEISINGVTTRVILDNYVLGLVNR